RNIGEASVFEDYRRQLLEVLVAARVEKIIVACPGCYHNLRLLCEWEALKDVEIQALPVALCDMELPMVACDPGASVCVHDSCPDRSHGVFADGIRALLAGLDIREVQHNRRRSQCCGMGKLRALTHPELSAKLTDDRLFELKASGADTVVAGCLTCVGALQPVARHYLELAFRTRVDWNGVHATMEEALKSFDAGPVAYTGLEERSSLG
ncbi:MAG TPA: hypothetical protein DEB24_02870, partial [Coriobacteriia bacterium]|nr:hypothetical protein [Coriobacteriia bacterium]